MTKGVAGAAEAAVRRFLDTMAAGRDATPHVAGRLRALTNARQRLTRGPEVTEPKVDLERLAFRDAGQDWAMVDIAGSFSFVSVSEVFGTRPGGFSFTGPVTLRRVGDDWKVSAYFRNGISAIEDLVVGPFPEARDGAFSGAVTAFLTEPHATTVYLDLANGGSNRMKFRIAQLQLSPVRRSTGVMLCPLELQPGETAGAAIQWAKRYEWRPDVVVLVAFRETMRDLKLALPLQPEQ